MLKMSKPKIVSFVAKLFQGGIMVASVDSLSKVDTEREIQHYALVYSQDGAVIIVRNYEVVKDA